jgi:hypothetical protein
MKAKLKRFPARVLCAVALGMGSSFSLAAAAEDSPDTALAKTSEAIPWSQIGAKAGADYKGDGLAVIPTADGARLRCVFQRLEGEATREGLWLTSTGTDAVNDRFRIVVTAVGRVTPCAPTAVGGAANRTTNNQHPTTNIQLSATGNVSIDGQIVRFTRPGLVEEYTVSMDGVRQDFVVRERPPGAGELAVRLAVSGAKVEPATCGARLVLENSGRKIAYSRLRVTDATGKELTARIEVLQSNSESRKQKAEMSLVVVVNDANAVYPVRIDPTFSDANWISMNPSIPGADSWISAAVVDDSGSLYIGGSFTVVGDVVANYIAKWNGSSWSALGSGLNSIVYALAVSGSDVYAGGLFTTAGGSAATNIAKWNGSSWSALGTGMDGAYSHPVYALAASGSNVYAGGYFTTAGGSAATNIAKWNGSSWSALGSGINYYYVFALAVSGSDLYAAGFFATAGGSAVTNIAKWNGSSWSALSSGLNSTVYALAVSGGDVYAGGVFTTAGGSAANSIAKWNGNSWSALGSGLNSTVYTLAVSGSDVYAGGSAANSVAKWNGSSWTALGSGMGFGIGNYFIPSVYALAVSGSDLYAGGYFTIAGGSEAKYIAKWNSTNWTALGSGITGVDSPYMQALAVSGSDVYAGGNFTTVGGTAANYIAKWNGSSWSALDSGMGGVFSPFVSALAVSGSEVYAGGTFTRATNSGGVAVTVNNIAKWNGSSWSALGLGIGGVVYALAVSGSDAYAGAVSRARLTLVARQSLSIPSPSGTEAVGRRWVRECAATVAHDRALRRIPDVGRRWVRGWAAAVGMVLG